MEKFRPNYRQPAGEFDNRNSYSESWNTYDNTPPKEKLLDMVSLGLLAIGIKAFLDPERYGDSDFIRGAIEEARAHGVIDDEGVHMNPDIELLLNINENGH